MKSIKKYGKYLLILVAILTIISLTAIKIQLNNSKTISVEEENESDDLIVVEEKTVEEMKKFSVDIKGAVVNPGVYEIEENKKVIDVINLAGGLTEEANTILVNLAKKVTDEMVIIIYTEKQIEEASKDDNSVIKPIDNICTCPKITNDACLNNKSDNEEINNNSGNSTSVNENISAKININTASIEELQTLSGIGESKAKAIVEYREANGNFETIEEIKNVSGIGESAYEKIKDFITV